MSAVHKAVQILLRQPVKAKGARTCAKSPTQPEAQFAVAYLNEFGYFKSALDLLKDIELEDVLAAIRLFQNWFGLPRSGLLTSQTVKAMESPRCGHPDIVRSHHTQELRVRDFAEARLPAWRKRDLKYYVESYVPGIDKTQQDDIFQAAFDSWSQHGQINVTRTRTGKEADILIGTGEGQRSNFDGPGGTLAWAYLPDGSDSQLTMRFDLGETWITNPRGRGILLLNVASHEFGHIFGLDHSKVQQALMAPYYAAAISAPQSNDDIPRFVARYGSRTTPPPAAPVAPTDVTVTLSGPLAAGQYSLRKVA